MKASVLDINALPTPKDEAWKYTNLARAVPQGVTAESEPQDLVIHKSCGQICEQPEEIVFTGTGNTLHTPKLKIVLEDGAQATVIERHDGQGAYWTNAGVDIELGSNAHLNHYRIFDVSDQSVVTVNTHILQERDSSYRGFYLVNGSGSDSAAGLVRNEIHAVLKGVNATCDLSGMNLVDHKHHADTTILIEHEAPHCHSSQFFRHLLADESRGVFQGKVHVHQTAQKTDGYQLSNAILLSEKAEMDTKPELEIYADDVKCSHGTTTGQIDENALFYLRSRGVNEQEARALLLQAFLDEVADKIQDDGFRARIKGLSQKWLDGI